MKRATLTPDQALERACRADLDQMPLPIVIAYVVSRGYSVTPDAGDVPFDGDAWGAEMRADINRLGEREWIRKLSLGLAAELDAKDEHAMTTTRSFIMPAPVSTLFCSCELCRARWDAVLESGCE